MTATLKLKSFREVSFLEVTPRSITKILMDWITSTPVTGPFYMVSEFVTIGYLPLMEGNVIVANGEKFIVIDSSVRHMRDDTYLSKVIARTFHNINPVNETVAEDTFVVFTVDVLHPKFKVQ